MGLHDRKWLDVSQLSCSPSRPRRSHRRRCFRASTNRARRRSSCCRWVSYSGVVSVCVSYVLVGCRFVLRRPRWVMGIERDWLKERKKGRTGNKWLTGPFQILIKCADISNPCRPWRISQEWSYRASTEFFRQGRNWNRDLNSNSNSNCFRGRGTATRITSDQFLRSIRDFSAQDSVR